MRLPDVGLPDVGFLGKWFDSEEERSERAEKEEKDCEPARVTIVLEDGRSCFWKMESRASGRWRVVLLEDGESCFWKIERVVRGT